MTLVGNVNLQHYQKISLKYLKIVHVLLFLFITKMNLIPILYKGVKDNTVLRSWRLNFTVKPTYLIQPSFTYCRPTMSFDGNSLIGRELFCNSWIKPTSWSKLISASPSRTLYLERSRSRRTRTELELVSAVGIPVVDSSRSSSTTYVLNKAHNRIILENSIFLRRKILEYRNMCGRSDVKGYVGLLRRLWELHGRLETKATQFVGQLGNLVGDKWTNDKMRHGVVPTRSSGQTVQLNGLKVFSGTQRLEI